jgi:nucleoside-diphosphate-sugar epimerase
MPVAVIGGAGFIGSHLVDELLVQQFEVHVIDNLSTGKIDNLRRWKNHPKLEFVRADANDEERMERFLDHKTWVFNFAPIHTPTLADNCMLAGAQRLVNNNDDLLACDWEQEFPVVSLKMPSIYGPRGPKTGDMFVSDVVRANMMLAMNRDIIEIIDLSKRQFGGWKPLVDETLGKQIMEQYERANSLIIMG